MSEYPPDAEYNKLVRDKIPERIKGTGLECETKIISNDEVIEQLKIKAVEESNELQSAEGLDDVKKEMSDVLEILVSLSKRLGISMDEIERIREDRAQKRGSFDEGIYLIRTYKKEG